MRIFSILRGYFAVPARFDCAACAPVEAVAVLYNNARTRIIDVLMKSNPGEIVKAHQLEVPPWGMTLAPTVLNIFFQNTLT